MLVTLKKRTVCRKQRLYVNCPSCDNCIVLDLEVFKEDPKEIRCEICKLKYMILSLVSDTKLGLEVNIVKHGN